MAGGRKLEFDKQSALEAAMEVFWLKGYSGASLSDLTLSMGINKPSMYSTFGNKEELFLKAAHYYIERNINTHCPLLTELNTPLRARLKSFMMSLVTLQCDASKPRGCFIITSIAEAASGGIPGEAGEMINQVATFIPALLEDLFKNDPEAKKLGLNKEASKNALCLATTLYGTSTMARANKKLPDLEPVFDNALKGLGL